jgi:hypothetical protein
MSEQHSPRRGSFARWREHRRAKRQEALERRYFEMERARSSGTDDGGVSAYVKASAKSGWWWGGGA